MPSLESAETRHIRNHFPSCASNLWLLRAICTTTMMVTMPIVHASEARIVYYEVFGDSAKELRRELNAKGPYSEKLGKRADGYTTWNISWKFRYAPKGTGCEFTDFSATLESTITLPRWFAPHTASQRLRTKWEKFMAALRIHEDGHYALAVQAVKEIEALGRSFHVSGKCSRIAKAFKDQATPILEKCNAANAAYDLHTHYGWNQGVRFP